MKRLVAIAAAVTIVIAAAAALLIASSGDDEATARPSPTVTSNMGKPLPPRSVEAVADEDAAELLGSTSASPVYRITAADPSQGPFVLRFPLPRGVDPEQLAVATREREGDMWTLRAGRVVGSDFVVRTPALSFWQLRHLEQKAKETFAEARRAAGEFFAGVSQTLGLTSRPVRCAGQAGNLVLTEIDEDDLLLDPCLEVKDEGGRIQVANNLGLALEMGISDELEIEETKGGSLPETAWGEINRRLSANTATLLPGAGSLTFSFSEIPQEVTLRPTSTAFWVELGLAIPSRGKAGKVNEVGALADWSECVYATDEGATKPDPSRFNEVAAAIWAQCGQAFAGTGLAVPGAALFDLFKLGRGTLDLRHLGNSAYLRADRRTVGVKAEPDEIAEQGASCGRVTARFLATDRPLSVVVGVVNGRILCEEARSVVREFVITNQCIDSGNTCFKEIGEYGCAAPTQGSYPRAIDCSAGGLRIVGIDAKAVEPIGPPVSCGNPEGMTPPGPYEVEANVPCDGAQRLALQLTNVPCIDRACVFLPFKCETETTGIESAHHTCHFGRVEVAFSTGA